MNAQLSLFLGAYHGNAGQVAEALASGADPNRLNEKGFYPLSSAASSGNPGVVESASGDRAEVSFEDGKRRTIVSSYLERRGA